MITTNYHTHTTRCNHAHGSEREYIEAAIQNGFKVLGFSDHAPYPYPDAEPYYVAHTMKLHELEDYCTTILALRREYKNDIQIHLGLETEYYPAFWEKHVENLSKYPLDYLILGHHFLENGKKGCASSRETSQPEHLLQYCDQVIEGLETGRFTYLAHPDLINFVGDEAFYDAQMRRLCRKVNELHIPVEINFHGYFVNKYYPRNLFWKIAGEENCEVVLGLDVHETEEFQYEKLAERAYDLVNRYHLHVLEDVTLRKPF